MQRLMTGSCAAVALAWALPVVAQDVAVQETAIEETVFDGDHISVGAGVAYSPSYLGSDDYVVSALPVVQGSYGGIDFTPRGAGLAIDVIPDSEGSRVNFNGGLTARLRSDRAQQINDDVVESLGELDRAVEVGPFIGVTIPQVLHGYDSLSAGVDVAWDVAGAHGGMTAMPTISYFTPLSRAIAASLSVSAEYADGDFHDYYFSVSPAQSATTGGVLPVYASDDGGFVSAGATLLLGYDFNGNLADGGWALIGIGGYSRTLGDASDTPYTSVRGTKDQFFTAFGIGYTF